jgi:hypothetical protein
MRTWSQPASDELGEAPLNLGRATAAETNQGTCETFDSIMVVETRILEVADQREI